MVNLTIIEGQSRISSEIISESIETNYKSTIRLIKTHKPALETFGEVRFQIAVGKRKTLAYLNEDQAIFLLTLSKNTAIVVEFKRQLVAAYSALRKKQAVIDENHAKVEWQQNRELGKLIHHDYTDTLMAFIDYAGALGSTNYPKHGYSMFAQMVNKALAVEDRQAVTECQLHLIATADVIVQKTMINGMTEQLPYKIIYQQAKREVEAFSAMVLQTCLPTRQEART